MYFLADRPLLLILFILASYGSLYVFDIGFWWSLFFAVIIFPVIIGMGFNVEEKPSQTPMKTWPKIYIWREPTEREKRAWDEAAGDE